MKKTWLSAILILCLGACYTPLNNSGVATTKPWLEVSGKKLDFDGKQYDSCYQFNIHFWPPEAVDAQEAAFWAVRRLHCLPLSFPSTTGAAEPVIGGEIFIPAAG